MRSRQEGGEERGEEAENARGSLKGTRQSAPPSGGERPGSPRGHVATCSSLRFKIELKESCLDSALCIAREGPQGSPGALQLLLESRFRSWRGQRQKKKS